MQTFISLCFAYTPVWEIISWQLIILFHNSESAKLAMQWNTVAVGIRSLFFHSNTLTGETVFALLNKWDRFVLRLKGTLWKPGSSFFIQIKSDLCIMVIFVEVANSNVANSALLFLTKMLNTCCSTESVWLPVFKM